MRPILSVLILLAACAEEPPPVDDDGYACAYPDDPAEPMALGEVIYPYSWPTALHADGRDVELDLHRVHCADATDVDWSVHDLLLFVSIPAW